MPVCKVLAARLKIQLQQLSHSNVLPRAGSRCSGAARRLGAGPGGVSVAGNCFKIITETWQAGTLHVSGLVSSWGPRSADECAPPLARHSLLWSGAWPPSPVTLSGEACLLPASPGLRVRRPDWSWLSGGRMGRHSCVLRKPQKTLKVREQGRAKDSGSPLTQACWERAQHTSLFSRPLGG